MGLTLILEYLYIGGLSDVKQTSDLIQKDVKHILTIDSKPLANIYRENFVYKHIQLLDLEHEDFLGRIEEALAFIADARELSEGVVVHCLSGQSRSGTAIIAYVMRKLQLDVDAALTFVKKMKADVQPNDGFLAQLRLFGEMGFQIDRRNQMYKLYQLERISQVVSEGHAGGQFSEMLAALTDGETTHSSDNSLYKCAKCRRILFTESSVLTHTEGVGDAAFSRPWQHVPQFKDIICKRSLFIEPVKWMQDLDIREQQGKLVCTKCLAKIGSWCWSGERCCCGTWVTPSFHIDSKKVDKSMTLVHLPSAAVTPKPILHD